MTPKRNKTKPQKLKMTEVLFQSYIEKAWRAGAASQRKRDREAFRVFGDALIKLDAKRIEKATQLEAVIRVFSAGQA